MNFNEILNTTIASLTCSIIVAISTILFKYLKKSYTRDSFLFWNNVFFYFDIFAIVFNAINFNTNIFSLFPLSFGSKSNLIYFVTLVICIFCTFVQYNNTKKYINHTK